ncbi:MAG: AI-2E family transporter [Gammaproteobacteria bacterium]|nr:AI-2E family transporter [Gammaproteobacteria bacterium]
MTTPTMDAPYRKIFILLVTLALVALFAFMVRDFLIAIMLAAIFTAFLYPLYTRLLRITFFQRRPILASATIVLLLCAVVGIPLAGFISLFSIEAIELTKNITPWVTEQLQATARLRRIPRWVPFADVLAPYKHSIIGKIGQLMNSAGNFIMQTLSLFTRGTFRLLLDVFVMLYAMLFFFVCGPVWREKVVAYLPLTDLEFSTVTNKILVVTKSVLKSILIIGVAQGVLIGLALVVLGVPGALFFGGMVILLSAIPALGAPVIWLPICVYLLVTGQATEAIGLCVWGTLLVGSIDNVLRPYIVGSESGMPDLLILVSTLGGIALFGAVGIIVGPIILAALVTLLEIYHQAYRNSLPN